MPEVMFSEKRKRNVAQVSKDIGKVNCRERRVF